jgi:hypothetical protein
MLLAQKQTGRPMDQNRKTHSSIANWSSTKEPKTHEGELTASSTNAAGKTGYLHVEDWN